MYSVQLIFCKTADLYCQGITVASLNGSAKVSIISSIAESDIENRLASNVYTFFSVFQIDRCKRVGTKW